MDQNTKTTQEKYRDIISLPRPGDDVLCGRHPRMSNADRAKIFSPFAALRGHGERLSLEVGKLLRRSRIELSEEEASLLSQQLGRLEKHQWVGAVYFLPDRTDREMGYYTRLEGEVTAIDPVARVVRIGTVAVPMDDLVDLFSLEEDASE